MKAKLKQWKAFKCGKPDHVNHSFRQTSLSQVLCCLRTVSENSLSLMLQRLLGALDFWSSYTSYPFIIHPTVRRADK